MGSDDEPKRRQTTTAFRQRDRVILVSTDAASEGLNLHDRCHHLIHLELPWNPNRLEQAQRPHRPLRPVARAGRALSLPQGDLRGAGPGPTGREVRAAAVEAEVRAQHAGPGPAGAARRGRAGGPVPGGAGDPHRPAGVPLHDHRGPARRPRRAGPAGGDRRQPEAVRVHRPVALLAGRRGSARRGDRTARPSRPARRASTWARWTWPGSSRTPSSSKGASASPRPTGSS